LLGVRDVFRDKRVPITGIAESLTDTVGEISQLFRGDVIEIRRVLSIGTEVTKDLIQKRIGGGSWTNISEHIR
jgi:hypothetical protein